MPGTTKMISASSSRVPALKRLVCVAAVVSLVGLGVAGCGDDSAGGETPASAPAAPTAPESASAPSPVAPAPETSSSTASPSSTASGRQQAAVALQAIETAQAEVDGGKVFDLEDDTERGQRVWLAKVATSGGRQFNLTLAEDGASVITNDEDTTPDDDVSKLSSAKVDVKDAIDTAASHVGAGEGALTSLEIDTDDNNTLVWQIEFGDDDGTTALVDATDNKILAVGPDVG